MRNKKYRLGDAGDQKEGPGEETERPTSPEKRLKEVLIREAAEEAVEFIDEGKDRMAVLLLKGLAVHLAHRIER